MKCPGCGDRITDRYLPKGVCGNCCGTRDDPAWRALREIEKAVKK